LGYCMNIAINCYPTAVPITSAPSVNFSITTPALNAGANTILVVAYDSTGYSRYDGAFTIDLTVPTAPVITTPTDGAVISSTATDVSGRADPDTTVEVYVGSTTDGTTVKTDYDGTWIKTDVPLSSGTNAIKAIAIDPAGNHSVDSAIVNVTNGPGLLITGNTAQIAGTAFNITITAKTINGTTDTGFVGLVHFTSDDIQATLPIDYQFDSGDNGTHTFVAGVTLETAGNKTVSATVISGPSTYVGIFTKIFTVSSGEASIITKVSGDSQSAVVNRYLEDPLVVLVKDAYDNIVPNQTLNVVVTGGGGSVPSATILTGSNGIASTTFKMGPTVGDGNNTLTIGSSGLTPVTFTTSATVFVYNVTPGDGSFIGEGYDATIDSSDQQASVIFDKGAVTENTNVTVESLNLSHSALAGKIFVSGFYDFKAENELGDVVTTFPIDTVIMLLTNNDKLASSVNFETALVYFWNENTDAWDQTGVDTIYKSAFTSQAITTHFTGFAVMADSLVASPTPTTTPVDATNPSGGITKQATAVSVVKLPSTGINSMIIYEFIIAMICGFGLSFFHPQIMIKLRIRQ